VALDGAGAAGCLAASPSAC